MENDFMGKNLACIFLMIAFIILFAASCGKNKPAVESETMKQETSNPASTKEEKSGSNDVQNKNSDDKNEDLKALISPLIKRSLDFQYSKIKTDIESTYTKEFLSRINNDFYSDDSNPYKFDIQSINSLQESKIMAIVRVNDAKGSYFQHFYFIKTEGKYLINNILNDV
jgi:hypothetical protein